MLRRESIQKTKHFFHRPLQNFKVFLFEGYQKLPEALPCNPFSCSNGKNPKKHQIDHLYADFSNQWESDQDIIERRKMKGVALPSKDLVKEEDNSSGDFVKMGKQSAGNNNNKKQQHEEAENEDIKSMGNSLQGSRRVQQPSFLLGADGGSFALFQKMKELEMVDAGDVDHVLDIEEVLHYYSRLKCPIYLDIVDKFFMDMHSEFFLPRASSLRTNSSSRRLGPLKL